jgi:hypothetical protein
VYLIEINWLMPVSENWRTHSAGAQHSRAKAMMFELTHGYCAYTDADNDQIFEKCDFLPGKPNTCELAGGTKVYEHRP